MNIELKLTLKTKSTFTLQVLSNNSRLGEMDFTTKILISEQELARAFVEETLSSKFTKKEAASVMLTVSHKLPSLVMNTLRKNRKRK